MKNRPGSNYDELSKWTKRLIKSGIMVDASAVITKDSLKFSKEIINSYLDLGLNKVSLRPVVLLGEASINKDSIFYSYTDYLDFWKNTLEYLLELDKQGVLFIETRTLIILKRILGRNDISTHFFSPPCSGADKQVSYDINGDIYPCDEACSSKKFRLGNISSITLILKSSISSKFSIKEKRDSCILCNSESNRFKQNIYNNQVKFIRSSLKCRPYREMFKKWLKYS